MQAQRNLNDCSAGGPQPAAAKQSAIACAQRASEMRPPNAAAAFAHHLQLFKHPKARLSISLLLQSTVQRWTAAERSQEPAAPADECAHDLDYLRQVVPMLTGFAGLGLPLPSSHSPTTSRPGTARGELPPASDRK